MGQQAPDHVESSLYCVGPGDELVHDILEVSVGSGGGAVLQDGVCVPVVAVTRR